MNKRRNQQTKARSEFTPFRSQGSRLEKEAFLHRYRISSQTFAASRLKWDDLFSIHEDHIKRIPSLLPTSQQIAERIRSISAAHSLKFRIKDPEHLIEKIIRKCVQNPELSINSDNYKQHITDLIGLRVLHLFKDDWTEIHSFILSEWDLAEKPTANIRRGDPEEFIEAFKVHGCRIREHRLGYRSVHYLVKTQPAKETQIAEVQVRTIFEEGWSEIDHAVRYPIDINDPLSSRILGVLNRLAGGADELGAYMRYLHRANDARLKSETATAQQRDNAFEEALTKINSLNIHKEAREDIYVMLEGLRGQNSRSRTEPDPLRLAIDFLGERYQDRTQHAVDWIKDQHRANKGTRANIIWGKKDYNSQIELKDIKVDYILTLSEVEKGGLDAFDSAQRTVGRFLNSSPLGYDEYVHALKIAFGSTPWKVKVSGVNEPYEVDNDMYATIEVWFETEPLPYESDKTDEVTNAVKPKKTANDRPKRTVRQKRR